MDPLIIQGGMGVGVSGWLLASAVSQMGQLGVVSGTALDTVFVRNLQNGDPEGHLRRALTQFPVQDIVHKILQTYFIPGGKAKHMAFRSLPISKVNSSVMRQAISVVANFSEVFLAKEKHQGAIGINFLEKIQLPMLPSLYGALLAGVDYVLMGAGIPREIPGVLDRLVRHEKTSLKLHVEGAGPEDDFKIHFDPRKIIPQQLPELKRPKFLAIIASATLATALIKKATGRIDGFVVESPTAGGHNAPPRGPLQLNEKGEPIYGAKDEVDFDAMKRLGLPFWLAGSYGSPEQLRKALQLGAAGVQVGTAFAFCEESGLSRHIKETLIQKACRGEGEVLTDPNASPAGFPFKVVQLENSISEEEVYVVRPRVCDLGYLLHLYKTKEGKLGYRCPGEPIETYLKKEGKVEETCGKKCVCNGLLATIGLPQLREKGYVEPPLVTAGDDFENISRFLKDGQKFYSARDVIQYLLGGLSKPSRA